MSESKNFYEQDSFPEVETVVLAESVKFQINQIANLHGKFFVKVLMPGVDVSSIKEVSSRVKTNAKGNLKTKAYTQTNYFSIKIPTYIALSFIDFEVIDDRHDYTGSHKYYSIGVPKKTFVIPKGTKMLAEFIGAKLEVDRMRIVGLK
jgi:hypothetical protein